MPVVKAAMGHRSLSSTAVYTEQSREELIRKLKAPARFSTKADPGMVAGRQSDAGDMEHTRNAVQTFHVGKEPSKKKRPIGEAEDSETCPPARKRSQRLQHLLDHIRIRNQADQELIGI